MNIIVSKGLDFLTQQKKEVTIMESRYILTTLNSAGYYQHNYFDSIAEINRVIKEYNIKKYQIYDIEQDFLIADVK